MRAEIDIVNIAHTLADIAADIARRYFRKASSIFLKKCMSPFTAADLAIETAIREYISRELPSHGILGEEYHDKLETSEYTWVIDPIDGTASFACGKPTFCTLIALLKDQIPVVGIIDQAITQERWCGLLGKQSTLNNKPCSRPEAGDVDFIKLSCTTPAMFSATQRQTVAAVTKLASVVSYGGDGYAYGLLASGHIDIILEADLKFYDVAALVPIIEGANGYITDWQGNKINRHNFNGTVLATGTVNLQQQILAMIN